MNLIKQLSTLQPDMVRWRHEIHKYPETAYEETRTADLVARELEQMGLEVHRGLAETGVVGVLSAGRGNRAIGLRADLDALNLQELNHFDHRSLHDGKMHACGHDGHTAMLLGAAKHLSTEPSFDGTVFFIFQPAEEGGHGAKRMMDEGLFDAFPCESVFGMHNMPGFEAGTFAVRKGPLMASADSAHVTVQGVGGHGAFPHLCRDPVLAAARIVDAWNTIVSRRVDPLDSAVISVTQFQASAAINVIPDSVTLGATVRCLRSETRDLLENALGETAQGIASGCGVDAEYQYIRGDIATVNHDEPTDICSQVAANLVGHERVLTNIDPLMGSEDFGWMLHERPGCYLFLGNGIGDTGGCMVHNPHYDFNDDILNVGAAYWVELARTLLPTSR
ncbi:M20 family metallopeptidase [Gammaproteobacteria bacterium]|nr:M20 family metallopeptidase [Gammaproteobacteria bacterium]